MDIIIQPSMLEDENQPQAATADETDLGDGSSKFQLRIMKDGKHCCSVCGNLFTQKTNLQRHLRKIHKVETTSNARTSCIHPGCRQEFYHKTKLIQHLEEEHGLATQKSELSFKNEEKFFAWKEREESQNFAYFSKERGAIRSSVCIHQTYACQRNGSSRSHKAKGCPARKTTRKIGKGCVKTDLICPARIITAKNLKTGEIKVSYYRSHSHPLVSSDTKFHPLPQTLRDDLKLKLALGVAIEDIQKDLARPNHSNIENHAVFQKQQTISRHHLQQMKRNMFKRYKSPEVADSITNLAVLLEKQRTEEHNPVIMYKPRGGQYLIGKQEEDTMSTVDSPAVIGLQTKQQMHMLQLFTIKYLCIDSVLYQENLLVNVGVRDDYGRGGPVAHLMCSPEDQNAIVYFFQIISERFNKSSLVGVITDETSSCINIVKAIFENNLVHVFCKKHVRNDWWQMLETIANKQLRREMYVALVMLMQEPSLAEFTNMTSKFVNRFHLKAKTFMKYFRETYLNHCPHWATCYGNFFSPYAANTVVYDDAFHPLLKSFFILESQNSENDLIAFLVKLGEERVQQSLPNCLQTGHMLRALSKHELAMQIPNDWVTKAKTKMYVVKTESGLVHHVKSVKKLCLESGCNGECLEVSCIELCPHLYSCSCEDESNLCAHIHRVHMQVQEDYVVKVRGYLTDAVQRGAAIPPAPPPPVPLLQQKPRRSPRHLREMQSEGQSQEVPLEPANQDSCNVVQNEVNEDDDDGTDNFMEDNRDEGDDDPTRDPGFLFNADLVPIEEDESTSVNLKTILNLNDELLFLLENEIIQANLLPYVLRELTTVVSKCKAHLPPDMLSSNRGRRKAKRKAGTPMRVLRIKMRGDQLPKPSCTEQGTEPRTGNSTLETDGGIGQDSHSGVQPYAKPPLPISTITSSVIQDLLSYVITSTSPSVQPKDAVYMISSSTQAPVPLTLSCEQGSIPSEPHVDQRGRSMSPGRMVMNAPSSSNSLEILHPSAITSSTVLSEPSPLPLTETMQPLAAPLQQSHHQRHTLSHVSAQTMADLASISSQLISTLPPTAGLPLASSSASHPPHHPQEMEYIARGASLTPSGTVVTQLVQRPAASPYPFSQPPPPGIEPSPLITTQATQALTLTGALGNPQPPQASPMSYLASQLGHRMVPPNMPLAQHLPSPYAFAAGAGQPLTQVHHQAAAAAAHHSLSAHQPRQFMTSPANQGLTSLQPTPFMSSLQPLHHLNPTPTPSPQAQLVQHQSEHTQRQTEHHMYSTNSF